MLSAGLTVLVNMTLLSVDGVKREAFDSQYNAQKNKCVQWIVHSNWCHGSAVSGLCLMSFACSRVIVPWSIEQWSDWLYYPHRKKRR
jgi:hypothetical protein